MQIKDAVLSGADVPLSAALQIERNSHELMYGTQDMREGTNAFSEKRNPQFRDCEQFCFRFPAVKMHKRSVSPPAR
jgi:1,4-dihydroxy-2-naphthoyl-CoA synthase